MVEVAVQAECPCDITVDVAVRAARHVAVARCGGSGFCSLGMDCHHGRMSSRVQQHSSSSTGSQTITRVFVNRLHRYSRSVSRVKAHAGQSVMAASFATGSYRNITRNHALPLPFDVFVRNTCIGPQYRLAMRAPPSIMHRGPACVLAPLPSISRPWCRTT